MCGVNAYFASMSSSQGKEILEQMNRAVRHRGPDGDGIWTGNCVGLAHRRLSIIDLNGGAQPMHCCNGRYVISYNGEIYNYRELRESLQKQGYVFKTRSDTEVIPAVIDCFGVQHGLNQLRGMFAFAMYDVRAHSLLLARDYVGIKPLYLAERKSGGWFVCSEIKSALATGEVDDTADGQSLLDFLKTGHIFSPRTAWKAVKEVRPGSWILLDESGMQEDTYWRWEFDEQAMTEQDALTRIDECLSDSVQAHLVSDVPVSCFLSGGVDSSLLTALITQNGRAGIDTFNVSFDEQKYNEAPYARSVAAHCKTTHHELEVSGGEGTPELLEKVLLQYDQPFGDSSALPTYMVCEAVSQHSKVIISGDGGDEMFGGYSRYSLVDNLRRTGKVPGIPHLLQLFGRFLGIFHGERGRQLQKAARLTRQSAGEIVMSLLTYFGDQELEGFVDDNLLRSWRRAYLPPHRRGSICFDSPFVAPAMISFEIAMFLHADYLRKVDIASMAHGLEVRTPFLDRQVFEIAASIPVSLNVTRKDQKVLLKKLATRYLPNEVVFRRKQGFGIPFDRWVKNRTMCEYVSSLLVGSESRLTAFLDKTKTEILFRQLLGEIPSAYLSRYQIYQRVFMLISLELWLRRWRPSLA